MCRYYFSYGSNMYAMQMEKRCPAAKYIANVKLTGWRFAFSPKHTGANIFETGRADDHVWGCLYKITSECELVLDECEGVKEGHYIKRYIENEITHAEQVLVYIVADCTGETAPYMDYHSRIIKALTQRAICPNYIEYIKSIGHLGVNNPKRNYQGDADGRAIR